MGPIARRMQEKLEAAFAPALLEIEDQSARHAGHAGATRPDGTAGETHFAIRIEANAFAGLSRVARQRAIYQALAEELAGPVHALALQARAPGEEGR